MSSFKAFVLNSIDYKESSKILYLYTTKGNTSVLAHGVKKMNSINRFLSQNGTLISLDTTTAKLPSLRDGEMINDYEMIKKDLDKYTYMNHIMELVRNVISDDSNHDKMFTFLEKLFEKMNNGFDEEILTFIFELKLLYFVGYGLNFRSCSICDENLNLVFNASSGGLICNHHLSFNDLAYDESIYSIIKKLYFIDIDKETLTEIEPNERVIIRNIIDMLYDEFISFKTKSRDILKQIKKY
jgi:DNA repair protein RecO (recombination protein O)